MSAEDYRIELGGWNALEDDAALVRHEVFIQEQGVSLEEEMDQRDASCVHVVAYDTHGTPVGTGRLLPDGHIGRMAVRKPHRGRGVGAMLLRRRGHLQVELAAQVHAQAFYAGQGFIAEGPVFVDAGIDHVNMRRVLTV